jgi:methionine synthase II (cobalamin-independent)
MFATLAGSYPALSEELGLADVLADQLEAGLGMLGTGRVVDAVIESGDAVESWRLADAIVRGLVAESHLEPPVVKACIVGPYSIGRRVDARLTGGRARTDATLAAAEQLNVELRGLFEAGVMVVQVQEDALTQVDAGAEHERTLAADGFGRLLEGISGHVSLAVTGGNAEQAGPKILFDAPFASYLFDLISGPDNWRLIAAAPGDRGIICGVADTRTSAPDAEAVMIWAARYAASLGGRGPERVGLAPAAGLEALSREVARSKLAGLAEAARKAALPDDELMTQLDPRAIDARSAALGRFEKRAKSAVRTGRGKAKGGPR